MFPIEKAVEELIDIYRTVLPGTPAGMNWWTNNPARVATGMGFGRAAGPIPGAKLYTVQVSPSAWRTAQQAAEKLVGPQTGVGYFASAPASRLFTGTVSDWWKRLSNLAGGGISIGAVLPPISKEQGLALVTKPTGGPPIPAQGPLGGFFESLSIGSPSIYSTTPAFAPGGITPLPASRALQIEEVVARSEGRRVTPTTPALTPGGRTPFPGTSMTPNVVGPRTQLIRSQARPGSRVLKI